MCNISPYGSDLKIRKNCDRASSLENCARALYLVVTSCRHSSLGRVKSNCRWCTALRGAWTAGSNGVQEVDANHRQQDNDDLSHNKHDGTGVQICCGVVHMNDVWLQMILCIHTDDAQVSSHLLDNKFLKVRL